MAQKVHVILEDDLDGSEAEESVRFGLDGVSYEIDLSAKNAKKLRESIGYYVEAGRRAGGRAARGRASTLRSRTRRGAGKAGKVADTAQIRSWARDQGYDISDRGRISSEIIEAYHKAHR